jgi:hypothetical protein
LYPQFPFVVKTKPIETLEVTQRNPGPWPPHTIYQSEEKSTVLKALLDLSG